MAAAGAEWGGVFSSMPRLDTVFVPCGDPGNHPPAAVLALAQVQAGIAREYHPAATMWLGPQGWNASELTAWYAGIEAPGVSDWLTGVVYGPWTTQDLPALRAATPAVYPIRLYPDICHSTTAQFPAWAWDPAFATSLQRETINPRPTQHAAIAARYLVGTIGFGGYSEGTNDDVNKAVWNAVAWGADAAASGAIAPTGTLADLTASVVYDYANLWVGGDVAAGVAATIFGLEANWGAPVGSTGTINATLATWANTVEAVLLPHRTRNWRLQQLVYRVYYDAVVQARRGIAVAAEAAALAALAAATPANVPAALAAAVNALTTSAAAAEAADVNLGAYKVRMVRAAEALYQTIGLQLSVPLYAAENTERGANLDEVGFPLNNAPYLLASLAAIANMTDVPAQLAAMRALVNWSDAGAGGFYDDLGTANEPHLAPGRGPWQDPQFFYTPNNAFAVINAQKYETAPTVPATGALGPPPSFPLKPLSWLSVAKSFYDEPLTLQYTGLTPAAAYTVTVVYGGADIGQGDGPVSLTANGVLVHGYLPPPNPMAPLTFAIPPAALAGTTSLQLNCTRIWDWTQSPSHSGCAIAEIWIRRNATAA